MIARFLTLLAFLLAATPALSATPPNLAPGPSSWVHNYPPFSCSKNYFVSPTGSDSNDGTTVAKAWATLQHANDVGRNPGDCVYAEAGTYAGGAAITHGGNSPAPNGYVVYRCYSISVCTDTDVSAGGQNGAFIVEASYVMIEGFHLRASAETQYGQGVEIPPAGTNFTVHHIWLINNTIEGYGQSCISLGNGEYFYAIYNTLHNCSNASNYNAQGSGISIAAMIAAPGYVRSSYDDSNPILGNLTGITNVVAHNVVYNDAITASYGGHTDGNCIIFDWNDHGNDPLGGGDGLPAYAGTSLVALNVVYNCGGGGVHIFRSDNVIVANNTGFNDYIDPMNSATYRAVFDSPYSYGTTFVNNIAENFTTRSDGVNNCTWGGTKVSCMAWNVGFSGGGFSGAPGALPVFTNNISNVVGPSQPYAGNNPMFNGAIFDCTKTNVCQQDPGFVSVATSSMGSMSSAPVGSNFALSPTSPALGVAVAEPYLPAGTLDVGACQRGVNPCGGQ